MKILFDHQAFEMQTHGGVSRCFWELYNHLPANVDAKISILESNNAYLDIEGVKPLNYTYEHFLTKSNWRGKARLFLYYQRLHGNSYINVNKNKTIKLLKQGNFDVFHPTYFEDYFLDYLNGKPFVLTIHDMIPELYPQYFNRDDLQIRMKQKLAPLARAIIAVSETTKKDILKFIDIPEEKVHIIYHGTNIISPSNDIPLFEFPYILYVGERHYYKRFSEWLKEVAIFLKRHKDVKVVCTGRPFTDEETGIMDKLGVRDSFVHFFVTNDNQFYSLYHNAITFVYTSEYEGFGIPILEAYQADCPVMLNNASCFPEVAGDAAIYFQLNKEGSNFAEQMEYVYNMSLEERRNLIQCQRNRLSLYSWQKASEQLVKVYETIC